MSFILCNINVTLETEATNLQSLILYTPGFGTKSTGMTFDDVDWGPMDSRHIFFLITVPTKNSWHDSVAKELSRVLMAGPNLNAIVNTNFKSRACGYWTEFCNKQLLKLRSTAGVCGVAALLHGNSGLMLKVELVCAFSH